LDNNGNRYEGDYKEGMKHGRGIFIWADQGRYEGPFVEDGRHGVGTCRSRDGRWGKCEFRNDKFVGWRK
jgi:hypothetical protein